MQLKNEVQKPNYNSRRVGFVSAPYAMRRVVRVQYFVAHTKNAAMIHVEEIINKGHFASVKNVAGEFVVSEMVLQ